MFGKPFSQISEDSIQTLIDNKERESSILEYKQEITGSEHEKKELSKDVSAMANTEGGYLIIGIKEKDGQAASITGTSKLIGRQPVELWLENILITNVRPKVSIKPKVIPINTNQDKVIVIVYIPQSSRRPHMVIAEGRNSYYVRHNYQATYADEHEVRSMFLESKTSEDEMKSFLSSRNLTNEVANDFALTRLSNQLSVDLRKLDKLPGDFNGNPFVLFAACPRYLEERIDIASSDFMTWLSTNEHIDLLDLQGVDFLSYAKTVSADSINSTEEIPTRGTDRLTYRYVEVFRNGYVENSTSSELIWTHEKLGLMFTLSFFTAAFWLFMKFVRSFYQHIGYLDEVKIIIALVDVKNLTLCGFGKKDNKNRWAEPYNFGYRGLLKLPTCKQKNVKIESNIIASELDDDYIEKIVKDVSKRVSNAFGEAITKCFDDSGVFDKNTLQGFRNIR